MGNMMGLDIQLMFGLAKLSLKALVALGLLYGGLRIFDKLNRVTFSDDLSRIRTSPEALADYYGRRLIAMAIVILGISIGSI